MVKRYPGDNLKRMANRKSPGRAARIVIHVEGGGPHEYSRVEDEDGNVLWRKGEKGSSATMTTAEFLKAIEESLLERRRSGRGLKFRL
jgi:hypothetical protein